MTARPAAAAGRRFAEWLSPDAHRIFARTASRARAAWPRCAARAKWDGGNNPADEIRFSFRFVIFDTGLLTSKSWFINSDSISCMRKVIVITSLCACLCCLGLGWGKRPSSGVPGEFTIGRHTFVDFGPPFDFYEIFKVQPNSKGTSVEKITLTPAANVCTSPAHVEFQTASLNETLADLLSPVNPCGIPEKSIKREMKRGKKVLGFGGGEVIMDVSCNSKIRRIKSAVLDKDMFDSAPDTPKYTSWTMQLLDKLNKPLGPGVLDKPMFPSLAKNEPLPHQAPDSQTLADVCAGMFDTLFERAPDKLSELCREAEKLPPPPPSVRLVSSAPVQPASYVLPATGKAGTA